MCAYLNMAKHNRYISRSCERMRVLVRLCLNSSINRAHDVAMFFCWVLFPRDWLAGSAEMHSPNTCIFLPPRAPILHTFPMHTRSTNINIVEQEYAFVRRLPVHHKRFFSSFSFYFVVSNARHSSLSVSSDRMMQMYFNVLCIFRFFVGGVGGSHRQR